MYATFVSLMSKGEQLQFDVHLICRVVYLSHEVYYESVKIFPL